MFLDKNSTIRPREFNQNQVLTRHLPSLSCNASRADAQQRQGGDTQLLGRQAPSQTAREYPLDDWVSSQPPALQETPSTDPSARRQGATDPLPKRSGQDLEKSREVTCMCHSQPLCGASLESVVACLYCHICGCWAVQRFVHLNVFLVGNAAAVFPGNHCSGLSGQSLLPAWTSFPTMHQTRLEEV